MFCPIFDSTSGDTKMVDIQTIKLFGVKGAGMDTIQMLDETGAVVKRYYYLTEEGSEIVTPEGWYTSTDINWDESDLALRATNVTFNRNQGLYIYITTTPSDVTLQTSGGVQLGEVSKDLNVGFNMFGNSTPHEINIQDIKLSGVKGAGMDTIQMLDETGAVVKRFYYLTEAGSEIVTPEGWYTSTDINWDESDLALRAKGVKFAPGQGLYLYITTTDSPVKMTLTPGSTIEE